MGVSQKTSGTGTSVSTTPVTLATITDAGEYQLWVDLSPLAAGDVFHVWAEGDVLSGGTDRKVWGPYAVSGVQVQTAPAFPVDRSAHSIVYKMVKIAGTDRSFDWSVREITATVSGTINANVVQISGDSTAADNLEAYCDGTTPMPVNVTQYGGTNGTFTSGRPNVNASHVGGTSQTGRDIGASVLLSSGTGAGQISLSSGAVLLQPTQTGVTIPTVTTLTNAPSDSGGVTTLLGRLTSTRAGYLDNLSAGAVATASALSSAASDITTLLGKFTGITSLAQWLGLIAGSHTGNSTARTELRATGAGSGTYDETTDSLQAARDEQAGIKAKTDNLNFTGSGASALVKGDVTAADGDTNVGAKIREILDGTPGNVITARLDGNVKGRVLGDTPAGGAESFVGVGARADVRQYGGTNAAAVSVVGGLAYPAVDAQLVKGVEIGDEGGANFNTFFTNGTALTTVTVDDVGTVSDKTGFKLASDGLDSISPESGINARQALSLILSAVAGTLSGAGTTTITIKNAGGSTTRITATVDDDGNRSSITLNAPS